MELDVIIEQLKVFKDVEVYVYFYTLKTFLLFLFDKFCYEVFEKIHRTLLGSGVGLGKAGLVTLLLEPPDVPEQS